MLDIIIPIYNEQENISFLIDEIKELKIYDQIQKIIFVNDSSTDKSVEILSSLIVSNNKIQLLTLKNRSGQSQAIFEGVNLSNAKLNIIIDGDGQINPKDIDRIYIENYKLLNKDISLVSGIRVNRHDSIVKKLSTKIAYFMRRIILNDDCIDTSCPLRLFVRDDFLKLPYFRNMHRFLPIIFKRENFTVKYIDISHRSRHRGQSKYGISNRLFAGIFDLIGVFWLIKRKK